MVAFSGTVVVRVCFSLCPRRSYSLKRRRCPLDRARRRSAPPAQYWPATIFHSYSSAGLFWCFLISDVAACALFFKGCDRFWMIGTSPGNRDMGTYKI